MLYWYWCFDSIDDNGFGFEPNCQAAHFYAGSSTYQEVELDDGVKDHLLEAFIYAGF